MLSKIREKATGVFAWIIVGIISVPFALWGINSYFEGGGQALVAEVEGMEIDLNTYQNALSERRRMMAQVLQQDLDSDFFESESFKRQVLDGLIQDAAEAAYAAERGYTVSDAMLGSAIRELPYFQVDGAFDPQRYQDLLANAGLSVGRFEQQQRQQLVAEQIRFAYTGSAFVAERDVDRAIRLLDQQRTADYAVVSADDPSIEVEVSDEEIAARYEESRQSFIAPEQMRVEYLELSIDEVAESIEVDDSELRRLYEENSGRYGKPAERRASHVLIQVAADADEETAEAARTRAMEIAERARSGEDFAALAAEYSEDVGSAANGGDLGLISRGAMVQPFEDAVFAMDEEGTVSDPVRTRFGFHVIKLTGFKPADVAPFEEVREQIADELKRRLAEQRYLELAEEFSNIVYEQPESLEPAADALQLEIRTTDWFSAGRGEGMAAEPRFRRVAFSEDVRIEGLNSEAFELDNATMVALRRLDTREERQLALGEVRDEIEARLRDEKRAAAVATRGGELVSSLESGTPWGDAVPAAGLEPRTFAGTRDDAAEAVESALVEEVFTLPEPGSDGLPGGFQMPSGDYVVYRLTSVTDGDPASIDESRREAIRAMIRNRQAEGVYLGYRERLREAAEVRVLEDQL